VKTGGKSKRCLPCEIAGTVGELGGAAIAYLATGSLAATAYVSALRWTYRDHADRRWLSRSGLPS